LWKSGRARAAALEPRTSRESPRAPASTYVTANATAKIANTASSSALNFA
jgi:hypothetical protein